MAVGLNMPALQMVDEGVETGVLGYDVKAAGRIGSHRSTKIIGHGKVEGVPAGGGEPNQLHRVGVREKLFDQGNVELGLARTHQQRETDGLSPDNREVNLLDVLEIKEDVVYRRREISVGGRHNCYATVLRIRWR